MQKVMLSIVAAAAISVGGVSAASAAPAFGTGIADIAAMDLVIQVKKGGNKGNWKGGGWKGGGYHHGPRHGWRRWHRGRACPYGFAPMNTPAGFFCIPL
jgi:hypothetical protein